MKSAAYRWVTVVVLLVAVTAAFFDRINIAVLFTNADFKHTIGVGNNPAMLGLLMTGFVIAYGVRRSSSVSRRMFSVRVELCP